MITTLVLQSHQNPLPFAWLQKCIDSVKSWCEINSFQYRFMDDALFDFLEEEIIEKTSKQKVIATDLARLLAMQQALEEGVDRVIWLDADFLIFEPLKFVVPDNSYAVGREVWVQKNNDSKLRSYVKVHNAFLMFERENNFLSFYIETATKLLTQNSGDIPPQFIGPKLLTALHNIVQFPVMEVAGMLSPLVIRDIVYGKGGEALNLFNHKSPEVIAGANLCCSSIESEELLGQEMDELILCLQAHKMGS